MELCLSPKALSTLHYPREECWGGRWKCWMEHISGRWQGKCTWEVLDSYQFFCDVEMITMHVSLSPFSTNCSVDWSVITMYTAWHTSGGYYFYHVKPVMLGRLWGRWTLANSVHKKGFVNALLLRSIRWVQGCLLSTISCLYDLAGKWYF